MANIKELKKKIKSWTDKIDDAIENAKSEGNAEKLKFLKEKLREYYKERRYMKMGGDENTSKGFLVPIKEIMKP